MAIATIALVSGASLSPSAAVAAFPGGNGRIAYVGQPAGEPNAHIFTLLSDGSGMRQLTDVSAFDTDPSWSPDGRRIVFSSLEGEVFTINADGTDLSPVVDPGLSPSFSPSGRRIVYATRRSIRTIRTDGTDSRRVMDARGGVRPAAPQYSPSGKRIAFAGVPEGRKRAGIWSIRRNGSGLRRLTDPERVGSLDAAPDYSPDGRQIAFHRFSGRISDGIRVMRADGSRERSIPGTYEARFPSYAPAGDRIVVSITTGNYLTGSCSDLYTMLPTGSDRRRVTDDCNPDGSGGEASSPSWQPDPPPSTFSFVKAKKNKKRGTAKLRVRVLGPGALRLAKTKRLKPARKRAAAARRMTLPVKPRGKARKRLRRRGRAKVKAKVTYTPDGAEPTTRSKRIRLRKRPR